MKHLAISILCLLAPLAAAQDAGNPVIHLGSTRVATSRGIKIIDRRTVPAPATEAAVPRAQRQGPIPAGGPIPAPPPLADTFLLHSRPSATKVIYLDFNGHVGMDGTYAPFNFEGDAGTFSDAELTRIQQVWQSVTEDFMPFDVDVTTQAPGVEALKKSGTGDTRWGQRVVIASAPWDYSWSYVNSFNSASDQEAYAYTGDYSWIWIADSISHEVGHSLGLDEHGQKPGDGTYYAGHGSGNTHWAPIMGWTNMSTPYGLSQWDKGEYLNATPKPAEDSLAIITTQNGFGYRPDDHGSTTGTATPVSLSATPSVVAEGVIEQRTDVDYFSFTLTGPGTVSLVINGDVYPSDASHRSSNLDVLAKLYNSGGSVIYTSNPATEIYASFNVALAAGSYYLSIDGTGLNTPTDGYSDYGSLGYYSITASMTDTTPPALTSSAITDDKSGGSITAGTLVTYTVTFSEDMDASTVTAADFGNAGTSAITIGTVTETTPTSGIFTVPVTPTTAGTLQFKVNAGAVLKDVAGNVLATTSAIADNTTMTVQTQYAAWSGGAAFDADSNNDGVASGLAWLLGAANPSAIATALLPKPANESGKLVLTFRCLKTANRGATVLKVQYSNALGQADPWTSPEAVVPDAGGTVGGVFFDTTPDADPAFINVRAEIPASAASPAGKLFGRLHATGN